LALGAAIRPAITRVGWSDIVMGLALGTTWWAHPPVALWTTTLALGLRLSVGWRLSNWRDLGWLLAGGLLGSALAAFPFATALSLNQVATAVAETSHESFVAGSWANLRLSFPACLLPISRTGDRLGDFQLRIFWLDPFGGDDHRRHTPSSGRLIPRPRRRAVGALLLGAVALLVLVLPVPLLTPGLWRLLPSVYSQLTNIWPMQRLYLPALAALVLAVGLLPPRLTRRAHRRSAFWPMLALALLVTISLLQAWPFVRRGLAIRQTDEDRDSAISPPGATSPSPLMRCLACHRPTRQAWSNLGPNTGYCGADERLQPPISRPPSNTAALPAWAFGPRPRLHQKALRYRLKNSASNPVNATS